MVAMVEGPRKARLEQALLDALSSLGKAQALTIAPDSGGNRLTRSALIEAVQCVETALEQTIGVPL